MKVTLIPLGLIGCLVCQLALAEDATLNKKMIKMLGKQTLPAQSLPEQQVQPAASPAGDVSLNPQPFPPVENKVITTGSLATKPALQPLQTSTPLPSASNPGIPPPVLVPIGVNAQDKINGNVLPLNSLEQLKSYENLPDSQLVQLSATKENKVVSLGQVRKRMLDDGSKSTSGGGELKYDSPRPKQNIGAVESMYAAAKAAAATAREEAREKTIKINGTSSPSSWSLAWNKPYFISSSDFKGLVSIKLQLLKQGKTFDLPITPGSSQAGGAAFTIPTSVIGVYEQAAVITVVDSDGASYTTAQSTFYPHIVTKNYKDMAQTIRIRGDRDTYINNVSEIKKTKDGFEFSSEKRADNPYPGNGGNASTFMLEIENFSPHWHVDSFGATPLNMGGVEVCDTFFAIQSNSGSNNVFFYRHSTDYKQPYQVVGSMLMLKAVTPVTHCRARYLTRANQHLFLGKANIYLTVSGPEGVDY